jgi:hypothetical protein
MSRLLFLVLAQDLEIERIETGVRLLRLEGRVRHDVVALRRRLRVRVGDRRSARSIVQLARLVA